jgi:3-methylcrotonyl-CoA carboxylase alpha subunit
MPDRPNLDFRRVLVANRGEIAVRVLRGLTELGLDTVAVYSQADAQAVHPRFAQRAVCIGPPPATDSYLDFDQVLDAARVSGAEAIHPGYGFLSENADFARSCRDAGLVFIGPSPESMAAVGGKQEAKELAQAAGVPVVPGYDGKEQSDPALLREAERIGFPLLVKASAGGGGKGMRLVKNPKDLAQELAAARREALAAFKSDVLVLERWIHPARHVEIQVFGDLHGDVIHLNERESSIQRRHQKVIEEAPSPVVDEALRQAMGDAAMAVARAAGYHNAGTVEFLVDEHRRFYFLEVNTRLQVEHPVTEQVTGLDLVHLQVAIARGAKLCELLPNGVPRPRGHAIEARIYAEDTDHGFLPAAGRLEVVREPKGPGVRVDSGVESGSEVPVHYDPMLAKIIVHAADRPAAIRRLRSALHQTTYLGIPTNVDFLSRVLASREFEQGALRTDFIELHRERLAAPGAIPDGVWFAAGLAAPARSARVTAAPSTATDSSPGKRLGALRLP